MQSPRGWIFNNWFLKIASLFLAGLLWAAVSNEASSEIGLEVPVEYRNIPQFMEITGDMTNTVQVRLRGSSNVIKNITARDIATTIDLNKMKAGEKFDLRYFLEDSIQAACKIIGRWEIKNLPFKRISAGF